MTKHNLVPGTPTNRDYLKLSDTRPIGLELHQHLIVQNICLATCCDVRKRDSSAICMWELLDSELLEPHAGIGTLKNGRSMLVEPTCCRKVRYSVSPYGPEI